MDSKIVTMTYNLPYVDSEEDPDLYALLEEEGDVEIECPGIVTTCWKCSGSGRMENPAFDNGFSQSEFYDLFDSPEDRLSYFQGAYDVPCIECRSSGAIIEIAYDLIHQNATEYPEEPWNGRALNGYTWETLREILVRIEEDIRDREEMEAIYRAERAMGA